MDENATELAAALKLIVGRIARRLRQAHAVGDLTLSEASLLSRLDREGPDSPGALAAVERVRPQAMAATVAALEERGLLDRRQHDADARRAVVALTETGRKVLADRRSESLRLLAATLEAEFTEAERHDLFVALPLLDRLAERL
jgi:DNA-binding MarR family transcriptional regulator